MAARSSDQPRNRSNSTPNNEAWREFLPACDAWWKSLGGEDEPIWDGFDWAPVEAALHELAHSALLGVSLPPKQMIRLLEDTIRELPLEEQIKHEAGAWVIEILACQKLGIPLDEGDAIAAAEVQGVHENDMFIAFDQPEHYTDELNTVMAVLHQWKTQNAVG